MIGNALGRHQERRRKSVRTLLRELGRILAARRRDRLAAVEQRMGVFVSVGESPTARLVVGIDQDRQADRRMVHEQARETIGQVRRRRPDALFADRLRSVDDRGDAQSQTSALFLCDRLALADGVANATDSLLA